MSKLAGKVAVITGGNSGIGLAAAKIFVEEGAYVYITGRRQPELDAAVKAIGRNVTAVQGDVSNVADFDRLYAMVQQQHGYINILFANAGGGGFSPLGSVTEEQFDTIVNLNLKGVFFAIQKALPLLQDGSSILLTASLATDKIWPGLSLYSASKSAVRSLARGLGSELIGRRIRVNAISPGTIDTPLLKLGPETTDEENERFKQGLVAEIPVQRIGTPLDIAKAALFLASEDSNFITGIELYVDGGMSQLV
jgi:NAD(P)-dependent dehydrogenase (short-subunit alcohol dehydrogenase family)